MSAARHGRSGVRHLGLTALAALALLLAACAADKPKPAKLETVVPALSVHPVWSKRIGDVSFALAVPVHPDRFDVASDDGTVIALNAASGAEIWRANVGERIAAGVGSDGRYDAVVTRKNELVTLDGGKVIWRTTLGSRVVTAPLVAGERVFVVGVDRVVQAFDAQDGHRLWSLKRPGDALLLAHTGVLAAWHDTLLVGQGTRLLGVDPTAGTVRWDVAVTSPRGTNEVERLADLVGPVAREGDSVCVRSFQNAVACVNAATAKLVWSQNGGGIQAVGGDGDYLFSADASDRLAARRRSNGELVWNSDLLLNRDLSPPAAYGPAVVFGDFEGQVHFLARATGKPMLRLPTDGARVVAQPALTGTTLLVVTARGGLHAFRPK